MTTKSLLPCSEHKMNQFLVVVFIYAPPPIPISKSKTFHTTYLTFIARKTLKYNSPQFHCLLFLWLLFKDGVHGDRNLLISLSFFFFFCHFGSDSAHLGALLLP
ncbi:hypothetical protein BS78_04G289900 [Paspalum vaginatum]|nr:hypothetical protein BS78_04G289900 [Paspalum vaginatum]